MRSVEWAEKLVAENQPLKNVGRPKSTVILVDGRPCVRIPLTHNKFTIVDVDDFVKVSKYNWSVQLGERCYAKRALKRDGRGGARQCVYLHREILQHSKAHTDHKNGDSLDNRRCNLRPASISQNLANQSPRNKFGFRGVQKQSRGGGFCAVIKRNGTRTYLGTFTTPQAAAAAWDSAAFAVWGDFARLNFPKGNTPLNGLDGKTKL